MSRYCKFFWQGFHKKYGKENIGKISIPSEFLGDFSLHYFLYDADGNVRDGTKNMISAIRKAKRTNLYISRVWD